MRDLIPLDTGCPIHLTILTIASTAISKARTAPLCSVEVEVTGTQREEGCGRAGDNGVLGVSALDSEMSKEVLGRDSISRYSRKQRAWEGRKANWD